MKSILEKLIRKRFYATKQEAQEKVDVFYAVNRITDEEYAELCLLIDEIYGEEETD